MRTFSELNAINLLNEGRPIIHHQSVTVAKQEDAKVTNLILGQCSLVDQIKEAMVLPPSHEVCAARVRSSATDCTA